MPVRREGCLTQRARVELGRVGRAILQTGQVADRDLPFAKRRVIPSVDAGSAVRRSAACVFSLRSRLVESGCPCDAPPHRTAPCRASEFASPTPFRGSRTKPKKIAARATPLLTPGSESWRPMPSRDGHLIRAALVGIQPEVCRSATTGERRRAAINRGVGETEAVCCLVADYHAVAWRYPADGGHAVTRSQTTTYPASWVDLGATSRPPCA